MRKQGLFARQKSDDEKIALAASHKTLKEDTERTMRQNDELYDVLGDKVKQMHGLAIDMNETAHEHNTLLDSLSDTVGRAGAGVKGMVKGLDETMKKNSSKHTVMMAIGLCAFFLFLYWLFTRPSSPPPPSTNSSKI